MMSAEIICVGTELLLGEVLNSNAHYLAQQLANLGIPHYHQSVVGDSPERIQQLLEIAVARSQILLFTGGLGPTPDDLTTATLADYFGAELVEQPEIWADIQQKYQHRGSPPSPSNRKQALLPVGAKSLPNPTGTAPGMIWSPRPGLTLLTFPGVPSELKRMWQETAIPYLQSQGWGQEVIHSRVLRFWGIPESSLAEKVALFLALSSPTVAPYAGNGESRLRISAKAKSPELAATLIDPVASQIRQLTGTDCYGVDEDSLEGVVGQLLQATGQSLSVAESCTGGGLGARITAVPGSSSYFRGGVIAYDNQVKVALLGVDPGVLEQEGAVSAPVAEQMATGVRQRLNTTWGLSITGIAGPGGGSETKPVGLVYIGLAGPEGSTSFVGRFGDRRGRDWVRLMSASAALDHLRRTLLQAGVEV
jgi:nicotinamide-nucleotide amidase